MYKSKHPLYRTWESMLGRCYTKSATGYHNYGGRGIRVCDEWRHDFLAFLRDMGNRPPGHELDRIDVNGHYCKENCRWITRRENLKNKRDAYPREVKRVLRDMRSLFPDASQREIAKAVSDAFGVAFHYSRRILFLERWD